MDGVPAPRLRPRLGLRPKTPLWHDGSRIDPPPSLACAMGIMQAATAAPAPAEEPAAGRVRSQGLRVGPNSLGSFVSIRPNSGVLVRPTVTRPAASNARA